jgi:hypothetical protein
MFIEMLETGIISGKAPVYLWKGRLAQRIAPKRPHSICVMRSSEALRTTVGPGYAVEQEQPMALRHEHTAPQPDVKVIRGRSEDYPRDFPTSANVPLVVEVSDSTLSEDRAMAFTYAQEEIPVYWIANLNARQFEVYTDLIPAKDDAPARYGRCTLYGPDEDLPVVLDGREVGTIRVREILR